MRSEREPWSGSGSGCHACNDRRAAHRLCRAGRGKGVTEGQAADCDRNRHRIACRINCPDGMRNECVAVKYFGGFERSRVYGCIYNSKGNNTLGCRPLITVVSCFDCFGGFQSEGYIYRLLIALTIPK